MSGRRRRQAAPGVAPGSRRRASRLGLACVLGLFLVSRAGIAWGLTPRISDTSLYFSYAARVLDLGDAPYSSDFPLEYPPLAWWTIAAAHAVAGARLSTSPTDEAIDASRSAYASTFRSMMAVADAAAFALLWVITTYTYPQHAAFVLAAHTVSTALLGHLLYDRLDAGLLLLLTAWALASLWRRRAPAAVGGTVAVCAALGAGIAYKLIPLLLVPAHVLSLWRHSANRRVALLGVASVTLLAAGPFAVQALTAGTGVFQPFTYHAARGLHVDTVWATMLAAAHIFAGTPLAIVAGPGGAEIAAPGTPTALWASRLLLAGIVATAAIHLSGRRGAQPAETYRASLLTLSAAVIVSSVFSPQYLVWALPVLLLLAVDVAGSSHRLVWGVGAAVVAMAALTTWVFPYHYFYLDASTPLGMVPIRGDRPLPPSLMAFGVLGVRNAIFAGTVVVLALAVRRAPATGAPA